MNNVPGKPVGIPASNLTRFDLVSTGDACVLDEEGHCITCSDEAQAARILSTDQELGTALVEINDETVEVDISLVDDVVPGDWLLVHGGVAIANIAEGDEAQRVPAAGENDV